MKRKLKEPYLDGKTLFEHYFKMGEAASITKLAAYAVSTGMTKVTYTNQMKLPKMGVWKAMWRWASLQENKDQAFQIFSNYVKNYGWTWDTDWTFPKGSDLSLSDWNRYMRKMIYSVWQHPTEMMYDRFLKKNGWN